MGKITTSPSKPTTERLTQTMIIRRFLRETESGGYGTVTADGLDASEFYDTTALQSGQYSEDDLEKCWIRVETSTDGNAPQGEIRAVSEFNPELGLVKVSPAFSAALTAGDTYQFFRWPHPQKIVDHIDTILTQECWLPTFGICTEFPDGDMELAGANDFTAVNSTIAKVSTEMVGYGRRYLSVLDGGSGGGYAKNAGSIYVEGGESYHLSALLRCLGAAEGKLVAYDVTNAAEISSITVSRNQWVRPWVDLEVPATCKEIEVRLSTVTASGTTYWDDVCLFAIGESSQGLPNWIEDPDQVKQVFRLVPNEINQNEVWSADIRGNLERGWDVYEDGFTSHNRLRTRLTHASMPLYIYGIRKEEAFSDPSADYKAIDGNWMHAELCVKVFESLSSWPGAGTIDSKWINAKLKDYSLARNIERYKAALRIEKAFQTDSVMVYLR